LIDDIVEAYVECQSFNEYLKEKRNVMEQLLKDVIEKYPNHADYFQSVVNVDDVKAADFECNMLKDAIKLIELKKELITDNAKECKNLLSLLHNAMK
jgi:hypothetical protein